MNEQQRSLKSQTEYEGERAFREGHPLCANPYPPKPGKTTNRHYYWEVGWLLESDRAKREG